MGRGKKHTPEQIVSLLRQIEAAVANGKTTPVACRESGITEQTWYRWRKEYGGLQVDQARRLKELEQENTRLKRVVANLSLDNLVLKDPTCSTPVSAMSRSPAPATSRSCSRTTLRSWPGSLAPKSARRPRWRSARSHPWFRR
jgi:transposase-like protein